jgi:hypothetical protein
MDLRELNRVGGLSNGTVPLVQWLENAIALSAARSESSVFARALDEVRETVLASSVDPRAGMAEVPRPRTEPSPAPRGAFSDVAFFTPGLELPARADEVGMPASGGNSRLLLGLRRAPAENARTQIHLDPVEFDLDIDGPRGLDPVARSRGAARADEARRGRMESTMRGGEIASDRFGDPRPPIRPKVFREARSGLLRLLKPEIAVRFESGVDRRHIDAMLRSLGLNVIRENPFVDNHFIAASDEVGDPAVAFDIVAHLAARAEVVFATPNFISQYRRSAPSISPQQWHLRNDATEQGQKRREDVRAEPAWGAALGAATTVALLDDGVDIEHPSLADRIWRDPNDPFRRGRDFFVDSIDPEHFDPRPKTWNHPFDARDGNDIHGTSCAGVIAANGKHGVAGVAPECTLLPLKIFHASKWAGDGRVGEAIEYAALRAGADILSCSWDCGSNPDVEDAIRTALARGRGGKGCVVVCSAGNDYAAPVTFPANVDGVIAVGASTDKGEIASYSNQGPEIAVVAPSSGGVLRVFTTDVSQPGRGYNGTGITTDRFGGTSAATAMVAGAASLLLAVRPDLRARDVRDILMETAEKLGSLPYMHGRNDAFGAGRIDLERALARARVFV